MRILRLANSDDTAGDIAPERRMGAVAERALAAAIGEEVETVRRVLWPNDKLPGLIDGWLVKYEPDVVSLTVSSFWTSYCSAPLKLRKSVPVVGGPLSRIALKASARPGLAKSSALQLLRRRALGSIGGAFHYEPSYIIPLMEECIRRILRREEIALAVRGPAPLFIDAPDVLRREGEQRRQQVHFAMAEFCQRLGVPYAGWDLGVNDDLRTTRTGDLMHTNEAEHQVRGAMEGDLLISAWHNRG